MGMVTLLSREGEVTIAKKIEAGEQEVLKSLLETVTGVDCILDLGRHIEKGDLRPKHVLRDIDEGDSFMDDSSQIDLFMDTLKKIRTLNEENERFREQLFKEEPDGTSRERSKEASQEEATRFSRR
jgi:RNA polymerase primary sigma factor